MNSLIAQRSITRAAPRPLTVAVALVLGMGSAHATNILVMDGGDSGTGTTCTLRQAIESANLDAAGTSTCAAGLGADSIRFGAGLAGSTITLVSGPLEVVDSLTITGSGQMIDADGGSRVLTIEPAASLTASRLDLTGGQSARGGGIYVAGGDASSAMPGGHLSLSAVTISGNNAARGGGIYVGPADQNGSMALAGGRASLFNTIISGNQADFGGGGIYVAGAVSLVSATVSGNSVMLGYGGGISAKYATVNAVDSSISGNAAFDGMHDGLVAGGIYSAASNVVLTGSTISGNSAVSYGDASAGHVTGGIYLRDTAALLLNCTLAGNSASGVGQVAGGLSASRSGQVAALSSRRPAATNGIYAALLINSTVAGNMATSASGGIYASAQGTRAVLAAADIVGGVLVDGYQDAGGSLVLQSAIVSGNSGETSADVHVAGASGSATASHSVLGASLASSFAGNGNIFADDPGIGPLADNGGLTLTRALLAGSPAIDAGDNALVPPGVTTDQRGAGYPRIVNGMVDIGAFEFKARAAPPPANAVPVPLRAPWALGLLGWLLAGIGVGASRCMRRG